MNHRRSFLAGIGVAFSGLIFPARARAWGLRRWRRWQGTCEPCGQAPSRAPFVPPGCTYVCPIQYMGNEDGNYFWFSQCCPTGGTFIYITPNPNLQPVSGDCTTNNYQANCIYLGTSGYQPILVKGRYDGLDAYACGECKLLAPIQETAQFQLADGKKLDGANFWYDDPQAPNGRRDVRTFDITIRGTQTHFYIGEDLGKPPKKTTYWQKVIIERHGRHHKVIAPDNKLYHILVIS